MRRQDSGGGAGDKAFLEANQIQRQCQGADFLDFSSVRATKACAGMKSEGHSEGTIVKRDEYSLLTRHTKVI
jgi:hypothetical protein